MLHRRRKAEIEILTTMAIASAAQHGIDQGQGLQTHGNSHLFDYLVKKITAEVDNLSHKYP